MGKVLITTLGSLGDLHPLLRMALELKDMGHQVVVGTSETFRPRVEKFGLGFIALKPDQSDVSREWFEMANHPTKGPEIVVRKVVLPYLEANFRATMDAGEFDLYINHTLTFTTPVVAELKKKPWLGVVLQPMLMFSPDDPPVIPGYEWTDLFRWSRWFYRALFRFGELKVRRWTEPVQTLRKRAGLKRDPKNLIIEGGFSPDGTIVCYPKALSSFVPLDAPTPKDRVRHVGFPFFDGGENALAPDLEEFLQAGEAPIVYTLGSAIVMIESEFYKIAAETHSRANAKNPRRAVLVCGDRAEEMKAKLAGILGANIFVTGYAPYSVLFPRAAAVVHQGGIGTLSQVLRAGVPQIVVPFAHDQPDNARRAERLGVAKVIPQAKLSVSTLARAIAAIDESMRESARRVSLAVQEERFAEKFREFISSYL